MILLISIISLLLHSYAAQSLPTYLYFNGIHQNDDYASITCSPQTQPLTILKNTIKQLAPQARQELINQIVAYQVVEHVLLSRELHLLTKQDLQKLNAIIINKLPIAAEHCYPHYKPGMLRKDSRIKSLFDGYAWEHLEDNDLKTWAEISVRLFFENLTLDALYPLLINQEQAVVNKIYVVYHRPEVIEKSFTDAMLELHDACKNKEDAFSIATRLHFKLVRIHPFCDGNGRTSRLFLNFILMKLGHMPIYVDNKEEYIKLMNNSTVYDYTELRNFIEMRSQKQKIPLNELQKSICVAHADYKQKLTFLYELLIPENSDSSIYLEEISDTVIKYLFT